MGRYIVLRGEPGLPPGWMPEYLEGLWITPPPAGPPLAEVQAGTATAYATDRFETRDDGAEAQVYEVRRG